MSRESWVFVIGCIVMVAPFLGIPRDVKDMFFVACGLVLMFIGFMLRRASFLRSIEHESGERRGEAFSESAISLEQDSIEESLPVPEDARPV